MSVPSDSEEHCIPCVQVGRCLGPRAEEEALKPPEEAQQEGKPVAEVRRAYEPPAIRWEEDFQPYVFSACGKMVGQGGTCSFRMSS